MNVVRVYFFPAGFAAGFGAHLMVIPSQNEWNGKKDRLSLTKIRLAFAVPRHSCHLEAKEVIVLPKGRPGRNSLMWDFRFAKF